MRFGLTAFCTSTSLGPAEVAVAAEQAGFSLVLFPDHTHLPLPVRSAYPGGGEVPLHYSDVFDPLVACAWALSATSTIGVGIGVCLVPARDPIVLAKQVASLDVLGGGRMVLGVGAGWNIEEVEDHGVAARQRWAVMEDRVLAMQHIWTTPQQPFSSRHVSFGPMHCGPTPHQSPHPPIMVGGHGPGVLRRVAAYGNEWLAMPSPGSAPIAERIAELHRMCADAGRPQASVSVQVYGADPPRRVIERYAAARVHRIDLAVPHGPPADMRAHIEQLAAVVELHR